MQEIILDEWEQIKNLPYYSDTSTLHVPDYIFLGKVVFKGFWKLEGYLTFNARLKAVS